MLDALKNIGGKGKLVQKQTEELETLLALAREERSALSAMLTAVTTRSAKLTPLSKSLEQVTEKAATVTTQLDEIAKRLAVLDDRSRELAEVDNRIEALKEAGRQAEQTTQKADSYVKQSVGNTAALKGDLDQIRAVAAALTQDYAKIRETARAAREDTNAAMGTVKEVEARLGPLARLNELSQSTEERLTTLNALAEHVSRKAKALESQQQAVHAVVQANRVNEMVWAVDVQIGKLNEGIKQAAKAEETIGRIERLSDETAAPGATKSNLEFHQPRALSPSRVSNS